MFGTSPDTISFPIVRMTAVATPPSMPSEALLRQREAECRLTPDRALESLDEAEAFLRDRGLLTLMPDCSLPSLFGACHEEPYKPGSRGFGLWPKTKYPWGVELAGRCVRTKLHRGKGLFLSDELVALVDPLCRRGARPG